MKEFKEPMVEMIQYDKEDVIIASSGYDKCTSGSAPQCPYFLSCPSYLE